MLKLMDQNYSQFYTQKIVYLELYVCHEKTCRIFLSRALIACIIITILLDGFVHPDCKNIVYMAELYMFAISKWCSIVVFKIIVW